MTAIAKLDKPQAAKATPKIPRAPHIVSSNLVPPPVQKRPTKKTKSKVRPSCFSARYAPTALRHRWLHESLRDMPCWLSSLVLHMTFILVLSSQVIPNQRADFFQQFTLSLAAQEEETEQDTGDWVVELPASAGLLDEVASEAAPQVHKQLQSAPSEEKEVAPLNDTELTINSELPQAEQAVAPPKLRAPKMISCGVNPNRRPSKRDKDGKQGLVESLVLDDDATDDEIVEAFIQYDIGKLRGREGQVALKRFRNLDSQSLPALIRGLNRSASISASCPVVVLTSTVVQKLAQSDDPNSMDYALENIGRDVPADAPYHGRIMQLLDDLKQLVDQKRQTAKKWRQRNEDRLTREGRLADQLAAQGYHVDSEIAGAVMELLGQSPETILHHLEAPAEVESPLAVAIVAGRGSKSYGNSFRVTAGERLTRWLSHDDPRVAHNAHLALVEAAQGRDLGPADNVTIGEYQASVERWEDFWADQKRQMREVGALRLLRMAEGLHKAGRRGKAAMRYRALIRAYPNTKAGQEAQRRLDGSY